MMEETCARYLHLQGVPFAGDVRDDAVIFSVNSAGLLESYCSESGEEYPAIDCPDGHVEFWENGVVSRKGNQPAIISNAMGYVIKEFWENGKYISRGISKIEEE